MIPSFIIIYYYNYNMTSHDNSTIELLSQRIQVLEKQLTSLMSDSNTDHKTYKKSKKDKKNPPSDSDTPPKKKRVSGYILFGQAERPNVKSHLETNANGDKVKSTDVMKLIGERWKALNDEQRNNWNNQAKNI